MTRFGEISPKGQKLSICFVFSKFLNLLWAIQMLFGKSVLFQMAQFQQGHTGADSPGTLNLNHNIVLAKKSL